MRRVTVVTDLPASPEEAFAVSLDIDEHVNSQESAGERAVAGTTGGQIALGETVTWSARHLGIRWRMTVRITVVDEPHRFVDEQVRGPFRLFRHEHLFEATPTGTRMTDNLDLASPIFGFVVEPLILAPHLRRLLRQRNAHLLSVLARR